MNQEEVDAVIRDLRVAAELLEEVRYRVDGLKADGARALQNKRRIRTGLAIAESKLLGALKPIDPWERQVPPVHMEWHGNKGNHALWHAKRGVVHPDCPFCAERESVRHPEG